jgi:hypothetical protein
MADSLQAVVVAVEQHAMELLVPVALVETESQLLQLIFNMEKYVIIDNAGGWLVNLVVWDGDTNKWQPPQGTNAVLASEIDFSTLPLHPNILNDPVEIFVDIEEAGSY